MKCNYEDCGWCYAREGVENNSQNGQCNKPKECLYLLRLCATDMKFWQDVIKHNKERDNDTTA